MLSSHRRGYPASSESWTPLASKTGSVVSMESIDTDVSIGSYGSFLKTPAAKYRELNQCDLIVFFLLFFNIYASRKLLFPFTTQFAAYYSVSIPVFAWILAAYDIGGIFSVLLNCFPPLHHTRIYTLLFLLTTCIFALYTLLSFSSSYIALFITRLAMGFVCTITQAQVRGILSSFLKSTDSPRAQQQNMYNTGTATSNKPNAERKLGIGMLIIESSWFFSTANWLIVGIVLNYSSVLYIWYLMSLYAIIAAITCYFLPSCTVAHVLLAKKARSQQPITLRHRQYDPDPQPVDQDGHLHDERKHGDEYNLLKQYHLYFFFLAYMIWAVAYNFFLSTFGAFMSMQFNLNAEQLGANTMVISAAECAAMVITAVLQRYIENMRLALVAVVACIAVMIGFMLMLKWQVYTETSVWCIIFAFSLCGEIAYLNLIIVNLFITPKGLESKTSLNLGVCSRFGTVVGVIVAPYLVRMYGFPYLVQLIGTIEMVAFILFCLAFWKFKQQIASLLNDV